MGKMPAGGRNPRIGRPKPARRRFPPTMAVRAFDATAASCFDRPDEPMGLVAGPIVAFRSWWIVTWSLDVRLCSLNEMTAWTPGVPTRAMCQVAGAKHNGAELQPPNWAKQLAPVLGCSCGLYGFRQIEQAIDFRAQVKYEWPNVVARCYGAVALWGRVIEHQHGWRAQWAYPLELWLDGRVPVMPGFPRSTWLDRMLAGLSHDYGIRVIEVDQEIDVMREAARWRVGPSSREASGGAVAAIACHFPGCTNLVDVSASAPECCRGRYCVTHWKQEHAANQGPP